MDVDQMATPIPRTSVMNTSTLPSIVIVVPQTALAFETRFLPWKPGFYPRRETRFRNQKQGFESSLLRRVAVAFLLLQVRLELVDLLERQPDLALDRE